MIFDTGTYISNDVNNYLHLPTLQTERMFVNTFGYCNTEPRTVDVVPGKVIVNSKLVVIEVLFATYICSDVIWSKCSKCLT